MATTDAQMPVRNPVPRDRRVRLALVGCGRISKSHFDALEKHKDRVELVAVCDTDPRALEQAHGRTNAPTHSSLDDLLVKTDADVVVLATPSGLHSAQAIQVAQTGRNAKLPAGRILR